MEGTSISYNYHYRKIKRVLWMTKVDPQTLPQRTTNQRLDDVLEQAETLNLRIHTATVQLINSATSANTNRAYRSALTQFSRWNTQSQPFQDQHIAQYLTFLHVSRGLAPASISLAFSAIKRAAKRAGIQTNWKYTTETLAGIRRTGKDRGRGQSAPLTYENFITLLNTCDKPRKRARKHETAQQARDRALVDRVIISLLFMAGMRRSEVADLRWGDVQDGADNESLIVQVRSSKSNQEGAPDYRLLKTGGADAVHELWKARQPMRDDFVIPLSCRQIANRFQACCNHAGLYGKLTAHSGRIGLASELITRGASTGAVALAGGWKSERMVLHYSQQARTEQGAVAKYL